MSDSTEWRETIRKGMMSDQPEDVKQTAKKLARCRQAHEDLIRWMDKHSRIGWYIACLASLNTVLNILDLFLFRSS